MCPTHPNSSAGRGLGPRAKGNFGQENAGTKDPFRNPSPMETMAQGERYKNQPTGPSVKGGSQNASGGGKPRDAIDRESKKDLKRHTGRE
jgi:hypothetical protein